MITGEFIKNNSSEKVIYIIDDDKKDKIINTIIDYCKKHNTYFGESVIQNDEANIEACDLIADIIDTIKFIEDDVD